MATKCGVPILNFRQRRARITRIAAHLTPAHHRALEVLASYHSMIGHRGLHLPSELLETAIQDAFEGLTGMRLGEYETKVRAGHRFAWRTVAGELKFVELIT